MQMQKGFDVVNLHGTASGVIATPYIGENENWWIGNEDTGINARGEKGDQGEPGPQGPKGDQAADMSRIEALETEVIKLNSDLKIKNIECGTIIVPNLPSNVWVDNEVMFSQPFANTPYVFVTSHVAAWMTVCAAYEISKTKCTIRIRNTDSTPGTGSLSYMAIELYPVK